MNQRRHKKLFHRRFQDENTDSNSSVALRLTHEYFALRAEQRAMWANGFYEAIDEAEEGALFNTTQLQQLVQIKPPEKSGYTKHKVFSWKDSKEGFQNKAKSERTLLWWNKRQVTKVIVLHFLKKLLVDMSLDDFKKYRTKIFRYLCEHGIEAYVIVEATRERPKTGKWTGRVHFHILTDDERSEKELRALFNEACERSSLFRGRGHRLVTR